MIGGQKVSLQTLDSRRKRIIFRAEHRGILEINLILGRYVNTYIEILDENQLDKLEHIMSFEDIDLLSWILDKKNKNNNIDPTIFEDICKESFFIGLIL